jgi:dephospho-CoA kinase
MYLVGLTGGIASGKSYVASLLAEHGADTIDADDVAREVVTPGSKGLELVVETFGNSVLLPSGELDRQKLGEIVFSDPERRLQLESILHPLIKQRTTELIETKGAEIVVYSVPLLVEANVEYPFEAIITVEAGPENQIERLVRSRGLSEEEARNRVAAQTSAAKRKQRADYVIDSSDSKEQTKRQLDAIWEQLIAAARGRDQNAKN